MGAFLVYDMITLIFLFTIFVLGFLVVSISKAYKNKYDRNMLLTFTSLGIFISEFLVWMGLVLSSDLSIKNPHLDKFIQYDFAVAVVVVAALILIYCLILSMIHSNIFWGIFPTVFKIVFVAIFGLFIAFQYLSRTEGTAGSMHAH